MPLSSASRSSLAAKGSLKKLSYIAKEWGEKRIIKKLFGISLADWLEDFIKIIINKYDMMFLISLILPFSYIRSNTCVRVTGL